MTDDLRAAALAATPGPWDMFRYQHGSGRIYRDRDLIADVHGEGNREWFYLASPDRILALLDTNDRQAARIAELEAALRRILVGTTDSWTVREAHAALTDPSTGGAGK